MRKPRQRPAREEVSDDGVEAAGVAAVAPKAANCRALGSEPGPAFGFAAGSLAQRVAGRFVPEVPAGTHAHTYTHTHTLTGVEEGWVGCTVEADSSAFDGVAAEEVDKFTAEREANEANEGNEGDGGVWSRAVLTEASDGEPPGSAPDACPSRTRRSSSGVALGCTLIGTLASWAWGLRRFDGLSRLLRRLPAASWPRCAPSLPRSVAIPFAASLPGALPRAAAAPGRAAPRCF